MERTREEQEVLPLDTRDCEFLLVTQLRDPFGAEVYFVEIGSLKIVNH